MSERRKTLLQKKKDGCANGVCLKVALKLCINGVPETPRWCHMNPLWLKLDKKYQKHCLDKATSWSSDARQNLEHDIAQFRIKHPKLSENLTKAGKVGWFLVQQAAKKFLGL